MSGLKEILAAIFALFAEAETRLQPPDARTFDPIAAVLQHPRCMNCHQGTGFLHQKSTDIGRARFAESGESAQCTACHQRDNSAYGVVPGAPGWRLPPPSMNWERLSAARICEAIKKPAKNGHRHTLGAVIEHMKVAPLVLWAWHPGVGRSAPAISHDRFIRDLETWVAAGAPCPTDAERPKARP